MAFSKAPQFHSLTYAQSQWSKALSHPARIIILKHLQEHGITPFLELARKIPLHQSTVSQHLQMLRALGLIVAIEHYPHTYYQINADACKNLSLKINSLNAGFSNKY